MNNSLSMENENFLNGNHSVFDILESAVSNAELLTLIGEASKNKADAEFATRVKIGIYKFFKQLPSAEKREEINSITHNLSEVFLLISWNMEKEVCKENFR